MSDTDETTGGGKETVALPSKPHFWRRGPRFTQRRAFVALALALFAILVALVVWLVVSLRSGFLVQPGATPVSGIQPIFVIQGPGTGQLPMFDRPLGVAFGPDGYIYVTDTGNNRVCVFDPRGHFVKEFGSFGVAKPAPGGVFSWSPGKLDFPDGIATDDSGEVYVADFHNDCVEVFDKNGAFLRRFPDPTKPVGQGSSGQDGQGIAVTAVAVRGDEVYATDTYQVFVYTRQGKLLRQFGMPGRAKGDLDHPNGIAVAADGTIYVSDSNHARVTAFTASGTPVWSAGRVPQSVNDTSPSAFELPRGLALMPNGDLVVVDVFGFDLIRLSSTGAVLRSYGERGIAPGQFNFPNDVATSGNTLAVADKENNRVQVLRLVDR
jgi:DNA-binding beta-propeller fold protein YncE